jgi:hypothetical protein
MISVFTVLLIALVFRQGHSFTFERSIRFARALRAERSSVITADAEDFDLDVGRGGVRLAQESVISLQGRIKHKPGRASHDIQSLKRYTTVHSVARSRIPPAIKIIGKGSGAELYSVPGETSGPTQGIIELSSEKAVDDLIQMSAGSAIEFDRVLLNVAGGPDLQVLEVLGALEKLTIALDVKTAAKVEFNSVSHQSFPTGKCFVTVVGMKDDELLQTGATGIDKSLGSGVVFALDQDLYYTVSDDDLNTSIA